MNTPGSTPPISPLQRALDELDGATAVAAENLHTSGYPATARTLRDAAIAVRPAVLAVLPPPAVSARAADLLSEYRRVGDGIDSEGAPGGGRWLDAVALFLRQLVDARMPSRPVDGCYFLYDRGNVATATSVRIFEQWEEAPAVRDQSWVSALKHGEAIKRDIDRGLTSAQIRDEIIAAVGMMAANRTPEMQARYDAAKEREASAANCDPTQESVNRKVEHELAVTAARMVMDTPCPANLTVGDLRRLARFVLTHAGEGPVSPPDKAQVVITGCFIPFFGRQDMSVGPGPYISIRDQLIMPVDEAVKRGFVQVTAMGMELRGVVDESATADELTIRRRADESDDDWAHRMMAAKGWGAAWTIDPHSGIGIPQGEVEWRRVARVAGVPNLVQSSDADREDSGMAPGDRGTAYTLEEAENVIRTHRMDRYHGDVMRFLVRRAQRLNEERTKDLHVMSAQGREIERLRAQLAGDGKLPSTDPDLQKLEAEASPPAAELVYEHSRSPLVPEQLAADAVTNQEALRTTIDEMQRAIMALRLEVNESIADEIRKRFEDVVQAFRRRHAAPSHELVSLRYFHDNVSDRLRSIRQLESSTKRALGLARLEDDVLTNGGQALMKPRPLDAIGVTVSGTNPIVPSPPNTATFVEVREDGAYTAGPPSDGRPVEHLTELANGLAVKRVIDMARRVVSRGIHRRRTLDEMMRGQDLNLLHNDLQGLMWLAEAVEKLDAK